MEPDGKGRPLVRTLLWLWVATATAAYLVQFRALARPIAALLGLA